MEVWSLIYINHYNTSFWAKFVTTLPPEVLMLPVIFVYGDGSVVRVVVSDPGGSRYLDHFRGANNFLAVLACH